MRDFEESKLEIISLIEEIFNSTPKITDVSWNERVKKDFRTSDPLHKVDISKKRKKVIINGFNLRDDRWYLDLLRALIKTILPDDLHHKEVGWNFSTIFTLLLRSKYKISKPAMDAFIFEWHSHEMRKGVSMKNLYANYVILDKLSPSLKIQYAKQLFEELQGRDYTNELYYFLHRNHFNRFGIDFIREGNIDFIKMVLKDQIWDTKEIELKSNYNKKTIQQLKDRYRLFIKETYVPIWSKIGLVNAYIFTDQHIRGSFSYKSTSWNLVGEKTLTSYRIPVSNLYEIMNTYSLENSLYLISPDNCSSYFSFHYDPNKRSWQSAYDIDEKMIVMNRRQEIGRMEKISFTIDHLKVLSNVIKHHSITLNSRITGVSDQKIRNYKRNLVSMGMYDKIINLNIQYGLSTAIFRIPTSEFQNVDGILTSGLNSYEVLDKLDNISNQVNISLIDRICTYNFPRIIKVTIYELSQSGSYKAQLRSGVILKITGIEEDLVKLKEELGVDYFMGYFQNDPESFFTLPIHDYDGEGWLFDVKEFLSHIKS